MVDVLSSAALWELIKHVNTWIRNLRRAKQDRQIESKKALRKVITASRRTQVYLRQLHDQGERTHETEAELAVLWTELGFELEDLGMHLLAERCQIRGKHWANPETSDKKLISKVDLSLERMEQSASLILKDI